MPCLRNARTSDVMPTFEKGEMPSVPLTFDECASYTCAAMQPLQGALGIPAKVSTDLQHARRLTAQLHAGPAALQNIGSRLLYVALDRHPEQAALSTEGLKRFNKIVHSTKGSPQHQAPCRLGQSHVPAEEEGK